MGCDVQLAAAQCSKLRTYQYQNHRAKETLNYISNPTGAIVESSIKRDLIKALCLTFDDEVDNRSEYDPVKVFEGLARYVEDPYVTFNDLAWNAAYAATLKAFSLPQSVYQHKDYVYLRLAIKDEKSSGAPEFADKGKVFDKDLKRMEKWLSNQIAPQPCVAQHRVQFGPKTRLVWAYPQMVTLAEASFARPLIDAYVPLRTVMANGKHHHKVSAMMTPMFNARARYGLDMSRFDSSPCRPLINMAFNILASNIDWSRSSREDWEKIKHYFIHTPILMPDGYVYTKHKGVPSGSYFTQLIDSVINHFIIQYVYYILTKGQTIFLDRILVLGDDSLFSSPFAISLHDFDREFKRIGFSLNTKKTCSIIDGRANYLRVYHGEPELHQTEFLGHMWKHGFIDRPARDVAVRMIYPERDNRSKEKDPRRRIRSRVYPYIADALVAHNIIYKYQKTKTNDIPSMYANIDVNWDQSSIGWKEHLSTFSNESLCRDSLTQAYTGILR